MSDSNEIKALIERLIQEYVLKLQEIERLLAEKNEDLRIIRKSNTLLEGRLAPLEQQNHELVSKVRQLERQIKELEEQIADLSQQNQQNNQLLSRLKHKNSSKLYAIIILLIVIGAGISFSLANRGLGLSQLAKQFTANPVSSAPQKSKLKRKKASRAASADAEVSTSSQGNPEQATHTSHTTLEQASDGK